VSDIDEQNNEVVKLFTGGTQSQPTRLHMLGCGSCLVTHAQGADVKSQQRNLAQVHGPAIDVLAEPRHECVFVVCVAANKKPVTQPEHLRSPKGWRLSLTRICHESRVVAERLRDYPILALSQGNGM
jgi:hypothetical protein